MGDEKQWHQHCRNEVGRPLQARRESNDGAIALVKCVEQIYRTENVEDPHEDKAESAP